MRHSLSRNTEGVFRFRHLSGRTLRAAMALVLCTAMLFSAAGCSDTPEEESSSSLPESQVSSVSQEAPPPPPVPVPEQRAYRTQLKGGGEDVVTVMMYFCGSDLESRGGAATLDLIEMMSADIGENVNVVVETGGSLKWATEVMDPTKNERWQVVKEDLLPLDSIEAANMSEPATLQNFITYSAEKFPADRYMLVLWDHGGGTVGGYAYDERYEDNSLMSIADLDEALEGAGVDFDMIGFDCCLMGTAETAFVAEKHADYMVASQRVEPGNGWEYTTWLTALSGNTSISTTDLGKIIVDGFVEHNAEGYYGSELTLSVLDLTHIPGLFGTMGSFFADVKPAMVSDGMFVSTSKMLGENRAMQKDHDLVDISVLAENMPGHEGLIKQLDDCVVYNGSTIDGYNGLCMYIPYRNLYQVEEALTLYEQVGIGEQYQDFVGSFANLLLGGQMRNSDGTVGLDDPTDDLSLAYLARSSWADESAWDSMSGFFDSTRFNGDALAIETVTARYDDDAIGSFESYAVPMTPEQWDLITDIRSCKTIEVPEAGEYGGYFELGYDIEWVRDDDGNLLVFSVAACNALDGHIAPYYTEAYQTFGAEVEDEWFADDWYSYGYVPVLFEGMPAEIVLWWDSTSLEDRFGTAVGWRFVDDDMGSQKGLFALEDGLEFDIVADFYYYDENGNALDQEYGVAPEKHVLSTLTIDGPPVVSQKYIGDYSVAYHYKIYDLFNNFYETESAFISGYDYTQFPEVVEMAEKITLSAHGEAEGEQRFTYVNTSDGETLLLFHDININEYALYKGKETVDGNNITITDNESGESFTFTVLDIADTAMLIETEAYGMVILEECEAMDAAVRLEEVPRDAYELGYNEAILKDLAEYLARQE